MVIGGIALIVLAALWLLRGLVFTFGSSGLTEIAGLLSLLLGALALTAGIVILRRGLARRQPS